MRRLSVLTPQSTQVSAHAVEGGVAAECPHCHMENVAKFDESGKLVWWPNLDLGTWCTHARGVYSGGGITMVFMFR